MAKVHYFRRLRGEGLEDRSMFAAGDLDTTFNGTGFNITSPISPLDQFSTTMGIFPTGFPEYTVMGGYRVLGEDTERLDNPADLELVFLDENGTLVTSIGTLGSVTAQVGLGNSRIAGLDFQIIGGTLYIVTAGFTDVSGDDLEFITDDSRPSNPYAIASATRDFQPEDVGSFLEILEDNASGFVTGSYEIKEVANGIAYLSSAPSVSQTVSINGRWTMNNTDVLVSRFVYANNQVTLDDTFGLNGHMIIPIASGVNNFDYGYSVVVDSLNRIVVGGYSQNDLGEYDFTATRLTPNGTLDETFYYSSQDPAPVASRGHVQINIRGNDYANAVNVLPNGNIILGGSSGGGGTTARFTLVQLDQFGVPVATFDGDAGNGNGIVTLSSNDAGPGFVNSIQIYPNDAGALAGYLLIAGSTLGSNRDTVVARINPSTGELDTTFASGGVYRDDLAGNGDDWGNSVALQANGAGLYGVVIAGSIETPGEGYNMYVARLDSDGTEDSTFYNGSFIHVLSELQNDGTDENDDYGATVMIDSNNKIVVTGSSFFGDDPDFDMTAVRLAGTPAVTSARVSAVNRTVVENDNGTVSVSIDLVLDKAAAAPVTVKYATQNGTAVAGVDFVNKSGTVTFGTGTTKRTVTVQMIGNTQYQASRAFSLAMTSVTGAEIAKAAATVTIRDNDGTWQNTSTPEDANNDGTVQAGDVLVAIDDINRNGIRQLTQALSAPGVFIDVDGDTKATPVDVLAIIDSVNRKSFFGSSTTSLTRAAVSGGLLASFESSASNTDSVVENSRAIHGDENLAMVGWSNGGTTFDSLASSQSTTDNDTIRPETSSAEAIDLVIAEVEEQESFSVSGTDADDDPGELYELLAGAAIE